MSNTKTLTEPQADLRDQFAMAALTGIISSPIANRSVMVDGRKVAMAAYEFADFMLSARSQEGKA